MLTEAGRQLWVSSGAIHLKKYLLEAGSSPEDWLAVSLVRDLPSLSKLWDYKIPSHCLFVCCLFVNVGSWDSAKALIFLRHVQC